jgi:hypothetical protein
VTLSTTVAHYNKRLGLFRTPPPTPRMTVTHHDEDVAFPVVRALIIGTRADNASELHAGPTPAPYAYKQMLLATA